MSTDTTLPITEADIWAEADACAQRGDVGGALRCLLSGFDRFPFYRYALQVTRWIRERDGLGAHFPDHARVRVALTGSFTLDPLASFVEIECLRSDLWPTLYVGGFNQFQSEILSPESPLFRSSPEVIFLATTLETLLPGFDPFWETPRARIDEAVASVKRLVQSVSERCSALVVVQNFAASPWAPDVPPSDPLSLAPRWFVRELNLRLCDTFAGDPRVAVFDFDFLVSRHGIGRAVDPKMRYLAGIEVAESLLPALARSYVGYVKTLKGLARKCIVLDLDGTLWGGVVGEDGIGGICLGTDSIDRASQDFQRYLLSLWRRGILLAVNSRNNPEDAFEVIRSHPGMLLREEQFASLQINWDDKAKNMIRIAEELNIALEGLVFVDDNPAERLNMRQQLSQVLTVELPADPSRYVETLSALNDFEILALTDEDRRRGAIYASERARSSLKVRAGSFEDYLRALQMTVTVRPLEDGDLSRAAQLTQKTNQFNMTMRRYTVAQLKRRGGGFTVRLADTFGDSGLVGLALVDFIGDTWHLDSLLMSCRVLGRRVEFLFVEWIAALAQKAGMSRLTGEYIPTAKNRNAADFFPACGFREIERTEGSGARCFELLLEGRQFVIPAWVKLVE